MHFKLRLIGNRVGIILPNGLLKKHNLHVGDHLICNDSNNSITLNMANPIKKYSLRDLVARSQPHKSTKEDNQWLSMKDTGKEVVW